MRLRGRSASGASAPTLSARVSQRLSGRGVDPSSAEWDAARSTEGDWTVILTFPAGGRERQARWSFDVQARTVAAVDDEARWLSEEDASGATSPLPAPHLVSAPVRTTTVYDVEAEGGVGSARHTSPRASSSSSTEEPLDLMSAMRERASHRGRPRRRKNPPTHTPVDDAPRHDALPLEDLAYDPESMGPPPGAKGLHPLDDPDSAIGDDVLPAVLPPQASEPEVGHGPDVDAEAHTEPEPEAEAPRDHAEASGNRAEDDSPEDRAPRKTSAGAAGAAKRPARRSVPSWDDVMFGAKPRD